MFALALDDQWPLVHLLVLHLPLVQRWVVRFVHGLESNQLLPLSGVALPHARVTVGACCCSALGMSVKIGAAAT